MSEIKKNPKFKIGGKADGKRSKASRMKTQTLKQARSLKHWAVA